MSTTSVADIENKASIKTSRFISLLWADLFPEGLIEELCDHPFLTGCRDGTVRKVAITKFLVQHQYYSSHFTRYLCAMMSSLLYRYDVKELSDNLFEEMGVEYT